MNHLFTQIIAIGAICVSVSCGRDTSTRDVLAADTETTFEPPSGTIPLTIEPDIVEFDGIIDYGVPVEVSAVSASGKPTTVVLTESHIKTPVFSVGETKDFAPPTPKKPNKASHPGPDRPESK